MKHVLGHADHTAPARQQDRDHADLIDGAGIYLPGTQVITEWGFHCFFLVCNLGTDATVYIGVHLIWKSSTDPRWDRCCIFFFF